MKGKGVMNHQLSAAIARMGHGDCLLIGDAGCAFPQRADICCIDLAVTVGVPTVEQVLAAVLKELVVESYQIAEEALDKSPQAVAQIDGLLAAAAPEATREVRPHASIKQQWLGEGQMRVFVRTGACVPYGYVMLVGGVCF